MANPFERVPLADLRQRTSIKWRFFEPDVLPMWVAEMDVVPAEAVTRAVTDAMTRGDTGYPHGDAYAEAFARFAEARWGAQVDVPRTALVSDVMMGAFELIRLLTPPSGSVIVTSPVYPPFHAYSRHAERKVVEAALGADLRLDLAAVEEACARVGDAGAVLLLCNPHNPTGTVHTRAELEAVAQLAARFNVRVISDEVHAPLIFDAEFTPYWTVDPRGFSLASASKAWNLAGLRTALIVGGSEAGEDLGRIAEVVSHGPSHIASIAHVAAFDDGREWLDEVLQGLRDNRALLASMLAEHAPRIRWQPGEATFLAWLDCRDTRVADPGSRADAGYIGLSTGPSKAFLERARVGLNAGEAFGTGGENHVRFNLGTRPDVIEDAVRRMGTVA
ncbi:aminotransferase class I/II-fold pyridoxal phosphate-dependent enzyme [Agrococcus sp. ARC_14]|uniref:MalY/PatB family protein n=1 Tax=Agrococcus sp. ARC_14 TaxID=2919927 RepID=UPI001F058F80|nr:aminotransferase class I/II-fold pyridoxal phosphate-dependent enzyme [Agrococcus sp. ARC_14]MCH1881514.1 aminotransferase class I/II-fold pyridoxal phosphate-dependent enzyme [Agrococcus sp. ARC_14]